MMNKGNDSEDDYGASYLGTNAPYWEEPVALPGEIAEAYHYDDDIDNIPPVTSE